MPMKPLTAEEIAQLRESLAAARKTDEHLCPDDLMEPVARLLDEVERSRKLLKQIEWNGKIGEWGTPLGGHCPACHENKLFDAHKAGCELAALLC